MNVSPPVAASSAFDDAFGDDFSSSTPISPSPIVAGPSDDFENAFADLPAPVSASTFSTGSHAAPDADFDTFDDDFSFQPTFDAPLASPTSTARSASGFDEFAQFDQTFDPAAM